MINILWDTTSFWILLFQQSLLVIYQQKTKLSNSTFGTVNIVQFPSFTLFMRLRSSFFKVSFFLPLINKDRLPNNSSLDRRREYPFPLFNNEKLRTRLFWGNWELHFCFNAQRRCKFLPMDTIVYWCLLYQTQTIFFRDERNSFFHISTKLLTKI